MQCNTIQSPTIYGLDPGLAIINKSNKQMTCMGVSKKTMQLLIPKKIDHKKMLRNREGLFQIKNI